MIKIQSKKMQSFFNELMKDYPELFNTHTARGREFITKYHDLIAEYDVLFDNSILALKSIIATNKHLKNFSVIVDKYNDINHS